MAQVLQIGMMMPQVLQVFCPVSYGVADVGDCWGVVRACGCVGAEALSRGLEGTALPFEDARGDSAGGFLLMASAPQLV